MGEGKWSLNSNVCDLEHQFSADLSSIDQLMRARSVLQGQRIDRRYADQAAGIGLGPLPALFFEDPVFKDILMPVMTEYRFREPTLYLVYVSRKYLPLKIRAFVDSILESISKVPPPKAARRVDFS